MSEEKIGGLISLIFGLILLATYRKQAYAASNFYSRFMQKIFRFRMQEREYRITFVITGVGFIIFALLVLFEII